MKWQYGVRSSVNLMWKANTQNELGNENEPHAIISLSYRKFWRIPNFRIVDNFVKSISIWLEFCVENESTTTSQRHENANTSISSKYGYD